MTDRRRPVYFIGVVAELCTIHPQTIRQYERLGLIKPMRVGRNRLFSQEDVDRIKRIIRLTQDMGVNLAGVEVVLKLQDEMEEMQSDFESQFSDYVREAEARMQSYLSNSKAPIRQGQTLLPVPNIRLRKREF